MKNFDLKKYLAENKLSQQMKEEEVNENFYNKPNTFKDGFDRSIEQLNNILNSNVRGYMFDEKEAIQLYSKEIKSIISRLKEISNNI